MKIRETLQENTKIDSLLKSLFLSSTLLANQPLFSQEDYFSMSVEELLSINVVSASRSSTSITDAPSIEKYMTTYNRKRLHSAIDYKTPNEVYYNYINNLGFKGENLLQSVS